MVVPVPCKLAELLKLLISTLFATSVPVVTGTTVIPYGFMSPLVGTVEATVLTWLNMLRNEGSPPKAGSVSRNTDPISPRKWAESFIRTPLLWALWLKYRGAPGGFICKQVVPIVNKLCRVGSSLLFGFHQVRL